MKALRNVLLHSKICFRELREHLQELSSLPRRGGSLDDRTVEHYLQLIVRSIESRGLH